MSEHKKFRTSVTTRRDRTNVSLATAFPSLIWIFYQASILNLVRNLFICCKNHKTSHYIMESPKILLTYNNGCVILHFPYLGDFGLKLWLCWDLTRAWQLVERSFQFFHRQTLFLFRVASSQLKDICEGNQHLLSISISLVSSLFPDEWKLSNRSSLPDQSEARRG